MCGEKRRELGRPGRFLGDTQVGGSARSVEDLSGVRSTGSTRRTGKPSTGGSGGQGFAACTGNRRRACRTGTTPANLPAGDSGQGETSAEASVPQSVRAAQRGVPPREVARGAEACGQRGGSGQRAGVRARADGEHPGPGGAAEAEAGPGRSWCGGSGFRRGRASSGPWESP